jgi:hypothetical protein
MQQGEVAAAVVFLRTSGVNRVSDATYDVNAAERAKYTALISDCPRR